MRLIDADELMESIRKALGIKSMTKSLLLPAERTIIDQIDSAKTIGGWISVKDKLPDRNGLYIVYGQTKAMRELLPDNDPIWMCYYFKERGFYDIELCRGYDFITHWMPLPEPPKENENE